ncbi:MAG: domain containing protein [Fibrobacteria bacterium]|jgi:beta-lactam-binding protein with PASTA domain|nr:domain containing protein [Fibrobacteria bacterium]
MVPRWLLRPVIPAFLFWLLALLAVFLVVDLSVMPAFAGRFSRTVTVPSVIGLSVEAAEDTLRAHDLRFAVDTLSDYSRTIPKGRILSQRPDSGAVVKAGRRVWAGLSRGRAGANAFGARAR